MAIGDVNLIELQKALTTTATASAITNTSTSYHTIVSYITLVATSGTTKRTVSVYKNGTATGNLIMSIDIDPTGISAPKTVIIDSQALTLTGTQALSFKQDVGTDINVYASGIREQIV
jgi:hypothetical protein